MRFMMIYAVIMAGCLLTTGMAMAHGESTSMSLETIAENRSQEKLKDYITMDIRMTQPFLMMKTASEWFVQVENLWDSGFETHYGYPDDGFRFLSGLNLMF